MWLVGLLMLLSVLTSSFAVYVGKKDLDILLPISLFVFGSGVIFPLSNPDLVEVLLLRTNDWRGTPLVILAYAILAGWLYGKLHFAAKEWLAKRN